MLSWTMCVVFVFVFIAKVREEPLDHKEEKTLGRVESIEPTVHMDDQQFPLHIQDGGRRRVSYQA